MNKKNNCRFTGLVKSIKNATIFDKNKEVDYKVSDIMLSIKDVIKGKAKYTIVPIEAWGQMSDAAQEFKVGDMITVTGHFANKEWKDGKDIDRKLNLIVLETIEKA